jgi:hypothetical protein
MKSSLKFFLIVSAGLVISFAAQSQDFPTTEKEITEILCNGKWELKTLGKDEKTIPASEAGMEFVIAFKEDGTYTMTMFGKERKGKWQADITGKQVKIYEKKAEPESLIKGIKKEQLILESAEGDDLKMVFEPVK